MGSPVGQVASPRLPQGGCVICLVLTSCPLRYTQYPTRSSLCRGAQPAMGLDRRANRYIFGQCPLAAEPRVPNSYLEAISIAISVNPLDPEIV